jgi:hypothetical protein
VRVLQLADFEDLDDVVVTQAGDRFRLPPEPADLLGVEGDVGRQHLDGHLALQVLLKRLVDHSHGAAAQLLENGEFAQPVPGQAIGLFLGRHP